MKAKLPTETVDFAKDLGNSIRENPISAGLIATGLVWLFAGGKTVLDRSSDVVGDTLRNGRMAANTGVDAASDRASGMASGLASNVRQAARELGDTSTSESADIGDIGIASLYRPSRATSCFASPAAEAHRAAPGIGGNRLSNLRDNLTDRFEEQPLFLGAVAIALGAGIAASIPSTDLEADLLGETSHEFRQSVSRFASEQKENTGNIVAEVAIAAAKAALSELTFEDVQNAVRITAEKFQRVVTTPSDSHETPLSGGNPS